MNPAGRSSGAMGCEHLKLHDKSIAIDDHCMRERAAAVLSSPLLVDHLIWRRAAASRHHWQRRVHTIRVAVTMLR